MIKEIVQFAINLREQRHFICRINAISLSVRGIGKVFMEFSEFPLSNLFIYGQFVSCCLKYCVVDHAVLWMDIRFKEMKINGSVRRIDNNDTYAYHSIPCTYSQ